jgi:hypothetical protein
MVSMSAPTPSTTTGITTITWPLTTPPGITSSATRLITWHGRPGINTKATPNVDNPAASSLLLTNANGAVCKYASEFTCFAPDWASVAYVTRQLGKKHALIVRNEYLGDMRGQRTGFKTRYFGARHFLKPLDWNDSRVPPRNSGTTWLTTRRRTIRG